MVEPSCESWFGTSWLLSQLGSRADAWPLTVLNWPSGKAPHEAADGVKVWGQDVHSWAPSSAPSVGLGLGKTVCHVLGQGLIDTEKRLSCDSGCFCGSDASSRRNVGAGGVED